MHIISTFFHQTLIEIDILVEIFEHTSIVIFLKKFNIIEYDNYVDIGMHIVGKNPKAFVIPIFRNVA
jgi:hypothetical protein